MSTHVPDSAFVQPQKKPSRRRIVSCETCRGAKTRCVLDPRAIACNRCQNLRIKCSLSSSNYVTSRPGSPLDSGVSSLEGRIANVETTLSEMRGTMDKICSTMQETRAVPDSNVRGRNVIASALAYPYQHGDGLANLESRQLPPLRMESTNSAPIMMVRKFRSGTRRLYKDRVSDIIAKRILTEDMSNLLASEFLNHQGRTIQIEGVSLSDDGNGSLRHKSPLLFAVCCLHGLRFSGKYNLLNSITHRQLYEEVRDMIGQAVLASPLPLEELYAIFIMCTFEAAPKPVFEYIESWLLSGICAQHAILSINFSRIIDNISTGKLDSEDKRLLSLWNNICLINLRFAVGTGKPPSIPANYIEQCPAILNHPNANVDDGVILAEILLYSTLYQKLQTFSLLDHNGRCDELTAWETKWSHLLDSPKAITLSLSHDIAYMVLARQAIEESGNENQRKSHTTLHNPQQSEHDRINVFRTLGRRSAHSVAEKFIELPISVVQELPKFHHICIAYCALVLSEYAEGSDLPIEGLLSLLERIRDHYFKFSSEISPAINFAIDRVNSTKKDGKSSNMAQENSYNGQNHTVSSTGPLEPQTSELAPSVHSSGFTGFNSIDIMSRNLDHNTNASDFADNAPYASFSMHDPIFNGEFMSFVDYFNQNS